MLSVRQGIQGFLHLNSWPNYRSRRAIALRDIIYPMPKGVNIHRYVRSPYMASMTPQGIKFTHLVMATLSRDCCFLLLSKQIEPLGKVTLIKKPLREKKNRKARLNFN
jgi:hypothetical protein